MKNLTREVWSVDAGDFPRSGTRHDQATFLLRYAVLAPSSHNTQPWKFRVDELTVRADALQFADPEWREELRELLAAEWGIPQVTFRIGHAEPEEHTPRRPVEEVLVSANGNAP